MKTGAAFQAETYLPQRVNRPTALVIFGGAGSLAKRKLVPALYNLAADNLLPEGFALLGAARTPRGDDEYRRLLREAVGEHSRRPGREEVLARLLERSYYAAVTADSPDDWSALAERLKEIDARHGTAGGRLLYLATPPRAYPALVEALGASGIASRQAGPPPRIVIEKPFGTDQSSATALSKLLRRCFEERHIYRIDHFLGKETVQNLLVFRFANAIFEPLLRRGHVHDVQITVAEDEGVGDRGGYYDSAGALCDMLQNHLLQLLCLIAMDRPSSLEPEAVRDEKVKVLSAIRPLSPRQVAECCVRGQYAGYLDEVGVAGDSRTETYAAVRLEVRNSRWSGVPFYLRTGKRLARRTGEIIVTFAREPAPLFGPEHCDFRLLNRLTFRLQPAEGISIAFDAKAPGTGMLLRPVRMDMDYQRSFEMPSPEAYERLLLDALSGAGSLFPRADEVVAAWKIVDSIRAGWEGGAGELLSYTPGSWGPDRAREIFADAETSWQTA